MLILRYIYLFILQLLSLNLCFQEDMPGEKKGFEYYRQMNNRETRLAEFKDDDEALRLKLAQLDIINYSRRKHRARPVGLDILASRVANKVCREAAENNFISHWNMAGEKPYLRYSFAGGNDHIAENVYGEYTTGTYDHTPSEISGLMKDGHNSFMKETPPFDGHKKNIIDKGHNYVGIGYYMTKDQFRYNEEFIDRYLEFEDVPRSLKPGEKGEITIKTDGKYFPYFLVIYREDFPTPLKPEQLNKKGGYDDFSKEKYYEMPAWDLSRSRKGNEYRIPVNFRSEGLYYIQICIDRHDIKMPSKLSTKGKIIASGIVIKVTG